MNFAINFAASTSACLLAVQVSEVLARRLRRAPPTVKQIQDVVEQALISANPPKTARAYIVYREQHQKLRRDRSTLVDVAASVNEYLEHQDWRVNADANQGYRLGCLILNVSGKVVANYWLNHVYPPEVGQAHRDGDIHVHDLDMLAGYCAGWSLRMLVNEGLNGVQGKVEAGPPNICRARWGTQTPFTNLTFDWTCPDDLQQQVPVIGGREMPIRYGDLQVEIDMINRAYIEVITTGDAKGRVFTFPIPTYNMTPDSPWESENA